MICCILCRPHKVLSTLIPRDGFFSKDPYLDVRIEHIRLSLINISHCFFVLNLRLYWKITVVIEVILLFLSLVSPWAVMGMNLIWSHWILWSWVKFACIWISHSVFLTVITVFLLITVYWLPLIICICISQVRFNLFCEPNVFIISSFKYSRAQLTF